jgi:hypothetical protein
MDEAQKEFSRATSRAERSSIGQFLTPAPIARSASLLKRRSLSHVSDPGAGTDRHPLQLILNLLSLLIVAYEMTRTSHHSGDNDGVMSAVVPRQALPSEDNRRDFITAAAQLLMVCSG